MALTTRALVLQRLGLTDDASTSGAIAVMGSTGATLPITITKSSTQIVISGGYSATWSVTASAYDTLGEVVSALSGTGVIEASIVDGVSTSLATSLLDNAAYILADADTLEVMTYSNTASGTVAALIDNLILEADYLIARRCNRMNESTGEEQFSSGSRDEYHDGTGEQVLQLRSYPVSAVSAVTLVGTDGTTDSTLTSGTDYQLDSANGRLIWIGSGNDVRWDYEADAWAGDGPATRRARTGWPCGMRNIRVQYTGGYSTVPYDLRMASTQIVVDMYLNRRKNMGTNVESLVGSTYVVHAAAEEILSRYESLFSTYRRVVL